MTRALNKFFIIALLFIAVTTSAQTKLTVAVAANMQYTFKQLTEEYKKENKNVQVDVVLGASGNLTQQIINGAPFDIFVSADTSYPQKIYAANFAAAQPKIYAQGILVVWTLKDNITLKPDLRFLLSDSIKSIAIANPKTAPYGTAAHALLTKYNLFNKVLPKLVTGESITQTSQFIATGNADVGFTAKAIVLGDEMKGKGKWIELNNKDYAPIYQSAVLLKNKSADAKKFYDFLYSAQAKRIYKTFGYIVK